MAFSGDFEPVLAKHSKHCDLNSALVVGLEQMQRNFKPTDDQITNWRASELSLRAEQTTCMVGKQCALSDRIIKMDHNENQPLAIPFFSSLLLK